MRKKVQHAFRFPPRLIIKVAVLREPAGVHRARLRADARRFVRRWPAAIIEPGPVKAACKKLALRIVFPPVFRAHGVTGEIDVIRAHIALFRIIFVDATLAEAVRRFRNDGWLLRKRSVKLIDVFGHVAPRIVPPAQLKPCTSTTADASLAQPRFIANLTGRVGSSFRASLFMAAAIRAPRGVACANHSSLPSDQITMHG